MKQFTGGGAFAAFAASGCCLLVVVFVEHCYCYYCNFLIMANIICLYILGNWLQLTKIKVQVGQTFQELIMQDNKISPCV